MAQQVEAKLTIAKLLEIAYSKNKGITTKVIRSKGNYKLTIDENGKATLSGREGVFTFNGSEAIEGIGVKIKFVSILFSQSENGKVKYTASFSYANAATLSFTGLLDLELLILTCSGLLCHAARALKQRNGIYERELKRAVGL